MKKLSIFLSIAFLIFIVIQFPYATINPGELVEGHQKIRSQCLACHKPFAGVTNEKCMSCHKLADIGLDKENKQNKILFHKQLSNQDCSSCHTDHQGMIPEHPLSGFKHELLSLASISNCNNCHTKPTDNLHTQIAANCNACHQTTDWKTSISFNHDVLLNKTNCASCHQKPDDKFHRLVNDNCNKCHNTSKWKPSTFDHSAYFILDQNHNTTCITCHSNNNYSLYTCYGCHEHTEANIIQEHNEEGIYNISNCASCHKSGNEHDIENNSNRLNENEQSQIKDFIKSNDKQEKDND